MSRIRVLVVASEARLTRSLIRSLPARGPVSVLDRVTDVPDGLPDITDNDFELQVGIVSFEPISPGAFYRVQLDT